MTMSIGNCPPMKRWNLYLDPGKRHLLLVGYISGDRLGAKRPDCEQHSPRDQHKAYVLMQIYTKLPSMNIDG
jgi:hypothetical protein